jgi:hypothetical protein
MAAKYTDFFHSKALPKFTQIGIFWCEIKPSGNPDPSSKWVSCQTSSHAGTGKNRVGTDFVCPIIMIDEHNFPSIQRPWLVGLSLVWGGGWCSAGLREREGEGERECVAGLPDFPWYNIPKWEKSTPNDHNYTKWPQLHQMAMCTIYQGISKYVYRMAIQ